MPTVKIPDCVRVDVKYYLISPSTQTVAVVTISNVKESLDGKIVKGYASDVVKSFNFTVGVTDGRAMTTTEIDEYIAKNPMQEETGEHHAARRLH